MSDVSGIDSMLGRMRSSYAPVNGYLKHDELYGNYPDVGDIHTRIDGELSARGSYNEQNGLYGEKIELKERPDFNKPKSTLLHESQHAIQQREGFQRGGNPEQFQMDRSLAKESSGTWSMVSLLKRFDDSGIDDATKIKRFNMVAERDPTDLELKLSKKVSYDDIARSKRELAQTPYESYQRLAGEAEARNVQTRLDWTPEQRRETPPWESLDVPENELIYRK